MDFNRMIPLFTDIATEATMRPDALAAWLVSEHSFVEQVSTVNEAYRLTTDGMVVVIFTFGQALAEGRDVAAAAMSLPDLCDTDGGGK